MARHKDQTWELPEIIKDWNHVSIAALWDIRDELKYLNRSIDQMNSATARMDLILRCNNTTRIPFILDRIDKNTRKPKRKKKV